MSVLCVLISLLCCVVSFRTYMLMTSVNPTLKQIEAEVSRDLEPRSHRLCMLACEIDLMQHNWQRIQMDDAWRDELHQYVSDFEEAVAQRVKAGNVKQISAYGGIRIQKKGA